jgi:peptide methionine sulfoxide reductase msrA/msrB
MAPGSAPGCATTLETTIRRRLLLGDGGHLAWDSRRPRDRVGYAGGTTEHPTVKTGRTGHAESVRITFDPKQISSADLLVKRLFKMHDPTTMNQQGNDVGTQYRSAIFYTSPEQKKVAEEVKARVQQSGMWQRPIVTEIVAAGPFTPAEDYHQDYLQKHPGGYSCHFMRN